MSYEDILFTTVFNHTVIHDLFIQQPRVAYQDTDKHLYLLTTTFKDSSDDLNLIKEN